MVQGCGGGLISNGKIINGPRGIGGEWGHNPLPWPTPAELPGPRCWCGQYGCMETWVSGPALSRDYLRSTGKQFSAQEIIQHSEIGRPEAIESIEKYISRLSRGLAMVINIFDPEVIVLGGGLSKFSMLYQALPASIKPYLFCDNRSVAIKPPIYGDDSGVRGAAMLSQATIDF